MGRTDLYDPRELGRLRPEERDAHAAMQAVESDDEARARGVPIREVHLDFFFFSFVFFFIFLVVVFSFLSETFSTFKFFPVFFDSTRTLNFICCSSVCTLTCPLNWLADAATDLTQPIDRPSPVHHDPRALRTRDDVPLERLPLGRALSEPLAFAFTLSPALCSLGARMRRLVRVCEGDGGVLLRLFLFLFLSASVSDSLFERGPGLPVCMRRRGRGRGLLRVVIEDGREDAYGREPHPLGG